MFSSKVTQMDEDEEADRSFIGWSRLWQETSTKSGGE